jgi:hypothetical protein
VAVDLRVDEVEDEHGGSDCEHAVAESLGPLLSHRDNDTV